jgi:hypothetical protein
MRIFKFSFGNCQGQPLRTIKAPRRFEQSLSSGVYGRGREDFRLVLDLRLGDLPFI